MWILGLKGLRKNQPAPGLLLNCGSAAVLEEELPEKKKETWVL